LNLLSLTEYDLGRPQKEVKLPDASDFLSTWFAGIAEKKRAGKKSYEWFFLQNNNKNALNQKIHQDYFGEYAPMLSLTLKRVESKLRELKDYKNDSSMKGMSIERDYFVFRVCDFVKMGLATELSQVFDREIERFFNKAREIWQSTKNEENSSLLEGLL
jgi:hypothetical protein